jgi:hypothetical protein
MKAVLLAVSLWFGTIAAHETRTLLIEAADVFQRHG